MLLAIVLAAGAAAPTDAYLDQTRTQWEKFSQQIWGYAETGLHEEKSAKAFEDVLEKEGFTVTKGVAGMPTAFVATAGKGEPVVAILAEYDALPGPYRARGAPLPGGCGAAPGRPQRGGGAEEGSGEGRRSRPRLRAQPPRHGRARG